MAKIILVSQHINSTSWQLAKALKAQQHEVVLMTSYGEAPPDTSNGIEIMAYFRRWSALEGLRIIPGLFGLQPQIFHLLLEEDRMNGAQIVLSTFAKSHPTCVLTTSLLHIKHGLTRRNPVRYLIEESDIITCPTVENLGQLRGLNVTSRRQGRGILPPVLDLQHAAETTASDEEVLRFVDSLTQEEFIVLPFRETHFKPSSDSFIRLRTIAAKCKVILWGSYSHWSLRDRKKFAAWMETHKCGNKWAVTGELDPSISRTLLQKSTALVLAGQHLTPIEMTEYILRAIQSHAVLVLDSKQSSVHADLWKNGVNCWVLQYEQLQKDLIKLLAKPSLKLAETLSEQFSSERHLMDSSLNELNRLYNRALNHLR